MDKSRIMIVEDESIIAQDIKDTLENLGYEVPCIASNGEEAILNAREYRPDLILMDIKIRGGMDGIDTAKEIRSRFNIPAVYLTSYADDAILERAKVTEPLGYLIKPFEDRDLKISIMMACRKAAMEKEITAMAEELKKRNNELQKAVDSVKILSGFLPICAWCKKVRDDKGYWGQIEKYISEHSEMEFSHGICPECASKEK